MKGAIYCVVKRRWQADKTFSARHVWVRNLSLGKATGMTSQGAFVRKNTSARHGYMTVEYRILYIHLLPYRAIAEYCNRTVMKLSSQNVHQPSASLQNQYQRRQARGRNDAAICKQPLQDPVSKQRRVSDSLQNFLLSMLLPRFQQFACAQTAEQKG